MNQQTTQLVISNLQEIINKAPGTYAAYVSKTTLEAVEKDVAEAEARKAVRREALMAMQKRWQESNPDGLMYDGVPVDGVPVDGVEYQKAIRAEWERE